MLETPSRVWRRIQDTEGRDMPSLPSLPAFDDSQEPEPETTDDDEDILHDSLPLQSTPAAHSLHKTASTIRPPSSTSSTARFARSIISRSSKSSLNSSKGQTTRQYSLPPDDSFDISAIPRLPNASDHADFADIRSSDQETESNEGSVPDVYLPSGVVDDDELDITEALASVSRSGSPAPDPSPKKKLYDYSVSLKSEPRASPFDKLRNVSIRRPPVRPPSRNRTPSLTHTISPASSPSNSTPHSTRSFQYSRSANASPIPALSIPLPRSATASPTAGFSARFGRSTPQQNDRGHSGDDEQSEHDMSMATNSDQGELPLHEVDEHTDSDQPPSHSQDEREPTFSSEEGMQSASRDSSRQDGTPGSKHSLIPSPAQLHTAFSSPAPSITFTPTPAFQPRPRARFGVPPQAQSTTPQDPPDESQESQAEEEEEEPWHPDQDEDEGLDEGGDLVPQTPVPATPYAHKRSFLLSVINSTARPRMKFLPTPHPHRVGGATSPIPPPSPEDEAEADVDETETQPIEPNTPGTALRPGVAFAGITPRPRGPVRRRLSHPLSHGWTATSTTTGSGSGSSEAAHDLHDDRMSVISTTSSQDLTAHARANASFDPIMGLGERGHGVGRFNAGKLNSYLHGLNRKLQEENEGLVEQLRAYEEKYGAMDESQGAGSERTGSVSSAAPQMQGRRVSGGGRRVSAGPLGLNDVTEDAAEVWGEEKAALEEVIDELKEELERLNAEKEQAEKLLEDERGDRSRDKERWRERMGEVEKGVEGIVRELESKQREAEAKVKSLEGEKALAIKGLERQLSEVVSERDVLAERVEQAESALEGGKGLGAELTAANDRVSKVMGELKSANLQMQGLEDDVALAEGRIDTLEKELREEKRYNSELQDELDTGKTKLSQAQQRITALETDLNTARAEIAENKHYITQLEEDGNAVVRRIQALEDELGQANENVEALAQELEQERERSSQLEDEADRAGELAKQMEEALEAAETQIRSDEEHAAGLKSKIAALERELDKSQPTNFGMDSGVQADIDALESELADANREVAKLNTLLSQSPARKAIEKAKDAKIELLERERDDLQERLKTLKNTSMIAMSTPHKLANAGGISPMHRQILAMSYKSPRTPGGPLRDLSWLQTTMNDPTTAPLFAEIERLQQELDRANHSIDEKLDRLEDAGLGVIGLTKKLEDAKSQIVVLEDEIGRATRREDRRLHRLEKLRCQKCQVKVDLKGLSSNVGDESSILDSSMFSLPPEPPTPPTRTSEKLRLDLLAVNKRLETMQDQWEGERRKLTGENAVLQDATKRLNAEVRSAKSELERYVDIERTGERGKAAMQRELERAKRTVDDLESELKQERARLRELTTEQSEAERQKEKVIIQLRRTESDMADIKEHLLKMKHENHGLENELRGNAHAEQKARRLEMKVSENTDTIEQLRQERSLLVADHKKLQKRYAEASSHVTKLREEHAASQQSHEKRRHQLDLQVLEVDDLRRALSQQATDLQRAEEENARIKSEKSDVARTVSSLEADLRRVKRDAEAFGRDLKALREQKERLEKEKEEEVVKAQRAQKQTQTQIRILKEELQTHKTRGKEEDAVWKNHVCAADETQLVALRAQHKNECKGLIVQIRYLKAKFTRESILRSDLGFQKRYLLALLARCERTENKILAVIATIGYPPAEPPTPPKKKKRSLKSAVISVLFLGRVKRASEVWREHCSSKDAIAAALQDVRRRRIVSAPSPSSGTTTNAVATSSKVRS
ncbi:hypothetical protein EIP91_007422 [Steccherinum ochraceum]|uniref:Pericentrin/AKAP-450 centrosomal targeting domain-containing protein n=1 Tax=Steccherinum ochraceum TaxID=92696 RepID=A0A4R0RQQ0_9APHY|nr:hypothetical protein EIP91_007422 [Steccherinum ochraceum]